MVLDSKSCPAWVLLNPVAVDHYWLTSVAAAARPPMPAPMIAIDGFG
jgi:hypothetical protein